MKDIYIGRQAILNRQSETHAFELLFRSGKQPGCQIDQRIDGDAASSEVLLNAFVEIGLDKIAGPHQVYINFTRNLILNPPDIYIDNERVVFELLEDIPVDQELLQAVKKIRSQGIKIALDDYTFAPRWEPLLPLVDVVKVEVPGIPLETVRRELPKLRGHQLELLAEKIETEEEYRQYRDLGFDYFQGYFFCRPKIIAGKRLNENQLVILRLISALNDPRADIGDLEKLIIQDASLSYKILRYINSAAIALPRKVESISKAVIMLGLNRIRAWASLLVMTKHTGKPQIHFTTALVRAHMCERLVGQFNSCPPETGFTVGLLSILDLLMDRPLEEIVNELSLTDEIKTALLKHQGPAGKALHSTLAYERHEWAQIGMDEISDQAIVEAFIRASEKAFAENRALEEA
jgi:EAL and modified HD-GYP domain-containing signal transduction protein